MSEKSEEVVYLNTCDLCIESLQLTGNGTVYLVWKKGKKFSQSLNYQLTQEPIIPKEILSLNLKIYSQGGKMLPKYASFIVYGRSGEEIDRARFQVTEWGSEYKQLDLNIAGGLAKIKVRRKSIMRLEHFHRLRGEVQESSDDQLHVQKKTSKKQTGPKQQLVRLNKQVQDLGFMVQKLKGERNGSIVRVQELQLQLSQVNEKMGKDIRKMKEYYGLKIQMHQSIFKDQIQQLVSSFNKNYQWNKNIVEGLIKQKYEYEQQISILKEQNQQYIQKQEQNYQNIIQEMEGHKRLLDEDLKDAIDKLAQRQADIIQLKNRLTSLTEELEERSRELDEERELRDTGQKQSSKKINQLDTRVKELQSEVEELKGQVQDRDGAILHIKEETKTLETLMQEHVKEKEELRDQSMRERGERTRLEIELQGIQDIVGQLNRQIEENKIDFDRIGEDYNMKISNLMKDHQIQRNLMKEHQQLFMNEKNDLIEKNLTFANENMALTEKYQYLQQQLLGKQNQNAVYKNEIQQNTAIIKQMQQEIIENNKNYRTQHAENTERLGHYMAENSRLQVENSHMSSDLRELTTKSKEDIARLREEYQGILESNKRLQEQQLEFYKRQREDQLVHFQEVKSEYEKQIQIIMNNQKTQAQQIERNFRQELQLKDKQYVSVMQKIMLITEQYDNYKLKVQKDNINQNLKNVKKPSKLKRMNDAWEPQEIPEQQSQEQQSFSQDSQEEKTKPKPKKIKKKKKRQSSESEDDEESDSLAAIFLKKKNQRIKRKNEEQSSKPRGMKRKNNVQQEPEDFKMHTIESLDAQEDEPSEQEKPKPMKKINDQRIPVFSELQVKGKTHKLKKLMQKREDSIQNESNLQLKIQQLQQTVDKLQEENKELKKEEKKLRDKLVKEEDKYLRKIRQLESEIKDLTIQIDQLTKQLNNKGTNLVGDIRKSADNRKMQREKIIDIERKKQKEKEQQLQHERQKQLQRQNQLKRQEEIGRQRQKQRQRERQRQRQRQRQRERAKQKDIQKERERQKSRQKSEKDSQSSSRKLNSPPKRRYSGQKNGNKQSQSLPKFDEQYYQNRLFDFEQKSDERQQKIQILQELNKQLKKNLERHRIQAQLKLNLYESKIVELQKRGNFKLSLEQPEMKKSINDFEERLAIQKERSHDFKIRLEQKVKENQQLTAEARKLKRQIQEKPKETTQRSFREIQAQLDESNRKILQLSRGLNFAKLERDTFQQQVRIIKKRLGQVSMANQQWQSKALEGDRQAEDLRRKDGKSRRQIQQLSEEIKKLRDHIRRLQEEVSQLNKIQGEHVQERKKINEQLTRLEQIIAKKEIQVIKSQREAQKLKERIQEGEISRQGRQTELKTEIQKVDQLRLKAERRVRELQDGIQGQRSQLESFQRESKRTIQSQKQHYGQKLKNYIEEIVSFKNLFEDYQNENSRLKIQNSQFFEQNQILKVSYEKLEIKYEGLLEQEQKFLEEATKYKESITSLKEQVGKKSISEQKLNLTISALRKELDNERIVSRKKSQKLQSYEQINERYLYEIKSLKIRLSEYESSNDLRAKLAEKCAQSERTIQSLEDQLRRVSGELYERSAKYVYSRQEVQQAMRDLKVNQEKAKEQEFIKLVQELDKNNQQKRQKTENQLIELFNENQRLRIALQRMGDESTEYQLALSQLQPLRERNKRLERDNLAFQRKITQGLEQIKGLKEEVRKGDIRLNQSIRNQEGKSTENALLSRKYQELNLRYKDLIQNHSQLKQQDKKLLQRYKAALGEKDAALSKLSVDLQAMANKLLAAELQVNRVRDTEKANSKEYSRRVKGLEVKMEEMNEKYREHQETTESYYEKKIRQLKQRLTIAEEELQHKLGQMEELNEGLVMMQGQIDQLTVQLTNARAQLAEEGEIYTNELNKLRGQIRESGQAYDANIRQLEEQLSLMSKELTAVKYNRQAGGSRLRGSRTSDGEDKNGKRYEDKLRMKQKRIDELKENILTLQETVSRLMRRQVSEESNGQIQIWKKKYADAENNWKIDFENQKIEKTKLREQIRNLKGQIGKLRNANQQIRLQLEEKNLLEESLRSQLTTINQLYSELQRQLDRRKNALNLQMGEDSQYKVELSKKQLELQNTKAILDDLRNKFPSIESELKKKIIENKALQTKLSEIQQKELELADNNKKMGQQQVGLRGRLKELELQLQNLKIQLKKSRNQISLLLKQNDQLKGQVNQLKRQVSDLAKQLGEKETQLNETQRILNKYILINEESYNKLGLGCEGIIALALDLKQKLAGKESQEGRHFQEIEELKFLYDRKYLDWEAVRKQNYELILRVQEGDIREQQLEQYHAICQQLQKQKKEAVFREEAMRFQLRNVLQSIQEERKFEWKEVFRKMQNILTHNYDIY